MIILKVVSHKKIKTLSKCTAMNTFCLQKILIALVVRQLSSGVFDHNRSRIFSLLSLRQNQKPS